MNQKFSLILQKLAWVPGSIYGFIMPWEKLAESAITLVSSCLITVATFFITRYLTKRFPSKKS